MIKIFIPSYARADTASTPAHLDRVGVDYKIVIREEEYTAYARTFSKKKLLVVPTDGRAVSGTYNGLSAVREYTRQTLKTGEWCLHIDDDMLGFVQCDTKFYKKNSRVVLAAGETMITRPKWQKVLSIPTEFDTVYDVVISDTMREAEGRGAHLCGFSAWENPAFRGKKFTDVGYVCGGMMLMRKQLNTPWRQVQESSCEDYALSAAHLYDNGRVLINKWVYPISKIYRPGGCGTYDERLPAMMRAQQDLCERYGALFAIKNEGREDKRQGELRLRFNSLEQVAKWRAELPHDPNWRMK